jgi:hypothetical protein
MYWSDCLFRSDTFVHKHEWAAPLVPPEYRQANLQAGGLGENTVQIFPCASVAIGNQTFIPHVSFGYYAIHVIAPPEEQASTPNFYILDFFTDNDFLAHAMQAAQLPAQMANFQLAPSTEAVTIGSSFAANVTEPHQDAASGNLTWLARLHWKSGHAHCWVDIDAVNVDTASSEAVLTGIAGAPATVSGPAHRLAGLGSHGVGNGHMTAPHCLGG